jgi:hypothetical protein
MGGFIGKAVSVVAGIAKGYSATKILGGLVLGIVAQKAISWLMPKPEVPDFDIPQSETAQGVLINKSSNNAQIPVVYGERKLGITRVFVETSGTDNQYLYVAGVLCEGEIESIESIYIDDKEVTWASALSHGTVVEVGSGDSNFYKDSTSHIQVQAFLGLDDQVSSSILSTSANWGTNHRLRGVAYLAFRFKWNQDIFGGLPDIKAVVKGRKVYDPRTTTTAYTNNSALCLLDYLRNTRYGKGLPDSAFEANFQSFQDSADECETQVTPYSGGSDIDLFTTNAVLDTGQKLIDNVTKLLNPMRAIFSYNQGTYKLNIEGTGTATYTLTTNNVIGGIKIIGETKNRKYNRVIGTFVNPEKNWQEDTVSFPPADDSGLPLADQHATMLSADNSTLLEGNFDFPNITNPYQAEELCENILRRSRNALAIEVKATSEFLDVVVGDIVNVTYPTASFSAKPFRVYSVNINADLTIDLALTEHQDSFYAWGNKTQAPIIADTTLPNPNSVLPPASLTLDDSLVEYNDGTVITRLTAVIGASTDAFVDQYRVEAKQTLDRNGNAVSDDYRLVGQGVALDYQLLNVIDGATYSVRVTAINSLGVKSTYVTATRTIIGSTAIPEDVTDFNINITGSNQMQLSWKSVRDLDIEFYEIRYQNVTSNANWFDSTNLVQVPRRKSNSVTINSIEPPFALLIKAVDKLGNESAEPSIIYSNVSRLENWQSIGLVNEETSFIGTYNNTFLGADANSNPAVTLDTISLFDSTAGNFEDPDALGYTFDTGGVANNIASSGSYDFYNTFSLDAVYNATFQVLLTMQSDDPYDLFDLGRGASLFDNAKAPFDGNAPTNCTANISVGTSNISLGSITTYNQISQQGTFKGRYFKFKANLL